MGTETDYGVGLFYVSVNIIVKLNNPLMGTETA